MVFVAVLLRDANVVLGHVVPEDPHEATTHVQRMIVAVARQRQLNVVHRHDHLSAHRFTMVQEPQPMTFHPVQRCHLRRRCRFLGLRRLGLRSGRGLSLCFSGRGLLPRAPFRSPSQHAPTGRRPRRGPAAAARRLVIGPRGGWQSPHRRATQGDSTAAPLLRFLFHGKLRGAAACAAVAAPPPFRSSWRTASLAHCGALRTV